MHSDISTAVIAEGGFDHLREIQRALQAAGLPSEVVRPPPERCST